MVSASPGSSVPPCHGCICNTCQHSVCTRVCLCFSLCNSGLSIFWTPKVFIRLGGIFTLFNKWQIVGIDQVGEIRFGFSGFFPSNPIEIHFILHLNILSVMYVLECSACAESPVTDVFLNFLIICVKKLAVSVAFLHSESGQSRSSHLVYSFAYLFLFFNIYSPFLRSGY